MFAGLGSWTRYLGTDSNLEMINNYSTRRAAPDRGVSRGLAGSRGVSRGIRCGKVKARVATHRRLGLMPLSKLAVNAPS